MDELNADVLLEAIGCREVGTGSRYFRKRMFFPFRPLEGDVVYFEADDDRSATVATVDWFIYGAKACLQVRLESGGGVSEDDIEYLRSKGWVECEDPTVQPEKENV